MSQEFIVMADVFRYYSNPRTLEEPVRGTRIELDDENNIRSGLSTGAIAPYTPPPVVEVSADDLPTPRVKLAGDDLEPHAAPVPAPVAHVEITEEPAVEKPATEQAKPTPKKKPPGRKPARGRRRS